MLSDQDSEALARTSDDLMTLAVQLLLSKHRMAMNACCEASHSSLQATVTVSCHP